MAKLAVEQKVELNKIKDLQSSASAALSEIAKAELAASALQDKAKQVAKLIDGARAYNLDSKYNDLYNDLKELGLEDSPELNQLKKMTDKFNSRLESLGLGKKSSWYKSIMKMY